MGGGRRELAAAVAGCLAGAALTLLAAGPDWVSLRVRAAEGAAPLPVSLSGGTLAPAATAFGLVGLAGVVAVAATRRAGRLLTGLVLLAAGVGVVVAAGRLALDPLPAVRASGQVRAVAPGGVAELVGVSRTAWPWLSGAGGVLIAASGALVALRGGRWAALSARYRPPADRPVGAWEALERGDDPTR